MSTWLLLTAETTAPDGLNAAGAVMMTVSIVVVLALVGFCLRRILRESKPSDRLHAPLDIDTHDRQT